MNSNILNYFDKKISLGILLFPFAIIYWILSKLNKFFSFPYKSKAFVVCVGNITLGGVGKTPLVIKIVELLRKNKIKVGVLSRGYKGKLSSLNPIIIDIKQHSPIDVGDEAFMINAKFNGKVPVCICKNRGNGAKVLEKLVDVIIMDDGLQNYSLKKDKAIIVIDGKKTIGNGFIFPMGPLRESIKSGVKKADAFVITNTKNLKFEKRLHHFNLPIFSTKVKPSCLDKFKNKKVIAFAGIGNPFKFYDMLRDNDIKVLKTQNFQDHHKYTDADFVKLIKLSNGLPILTTQKDFVKIPMEYRKYISMIDIDLEISDEKKFFDLLFGKLLKTIHS